ncbi:MAG: 6-phosphogluconolactonase [Acidobacteriaceae bacterium]
MARAVTVEYKVWPTGAEVAAGAAEMFAAVTAAAVNARGLARVAISGGTTPKTMLALLADPGKPYFAAVPWQKLQLFWVDERCVPPHDKDSNYRMTQEAMLSHVPLASAQVFRMEGELDPEVAASRYEAAIRTAFRLEGAETPTFDLILLGMGDDGHTASLFPHTEALNELARIVVANHVPQKDTWRISLTWPVINRGREVAFLIEGAAKTEVLHDVLLGAYDPETLPSQLIRPANGRLTLLLDSAAAAKLPEATGGSDPKTGTLEIR